MPEIIASTSSGNYEIIVAGGSIKRAGIIAASVVTGRKAYIVTDRNVAGSYLAPLAASLETSGFVTRYSILPPGESTKCSEKLVGLYNDFHRAEITRSDLIVALGGGVIGDLAGFAASSYLRGVPLIQIPTTLLAQVDSSVGGKTAINMPFGKNCVGAFYQPKAVIADPEVLSTLPEEEFSAGMAEVIKSGCIKDPELFEKIEEGSIDPEWMVERCVRIKTRVVSADERDTGERMLLNFGHTVGHAIEKASDYSGHTHGQAVSVGMAAAARMGEMIGITIPGTASRIESVLSGSGLPVKTDIPVKDILAAIRSDKKKLSDTIYFVLLKEIGDSVLYPISPVNLDGILTEVLGQWQK